MNLFAQAIQHEENQDFDAAVKVYKKLVREDSQNAPAFINLGTIMYNKRKLEEAIGHYRTALCIDSEYALARFNLGNCLDEMGRPAEAVVEYQKAIQTQSDYADAHYNLAISLQKLFKEKEALIHWEKYVKLDRTGPWNTHAKNEIKKLRSKSSLEIVWRNPVRLWNQKKTPAKLTLLKTKVP